MEPTQITTQQIRRLSILLALYHILMISLINGLITIPLEVWGRKMNYGLFLYPLIYITTDLAVRFLGKSAARDAIRWTWIPSSLITFVELSTIAHEPWSVALRVAVASGLAYLWPLWLDTVIFGWVRARTPAWWAPPLVSLFISVPLQTYSFYAMSFAGGHNAYMAQHWPELATSSLVMKSMIMTAMVIPGYGVLLAWLTRRWR
jgi:uncharacterized integral membrane protein (TIGR00697 family)